MVPSLVNGGAEGTWPPKDHGHVKKPHGCHGIDYPQEIKRKSVVKRVVKSFTGDIGTIPAPQEVKKERWSRVK